MRHLELTHKQVLRIFPWLKGRTLIKWSQERLVQSAAQGRGSVRRYNFVNLLEIAFVSELFDCGLGLYDALSIMGEFRKRINRNEFDTVVVIPKHRDLTLPHGAGRRDWSEPHSLLINDFNQKVFKSKEKKMTVSVIAVNLRTLKDFVEAQLKGAGV